MNHSAIEFQLLNLWISTVPPPPPPATKHSISTQPGFHLTSFFPQAFLTTNSKFKLHFLLNISKYLHSPAHFQVRRKSPEPMSFHSLENVAFKVFSAQKLASFSEDIWWESVKAQRSSSWKGSNLIQRYCSMWQESCNGLPNSVPHQKIKMPSRKSNMKHAGDILSYLLSLENYRFGIYNYGI